MGDTSPRWLETWLRWDVTQIRWPEAQMTWYSTRMNWDSKWLTLDLTWFEKFETLETLDMIWHVLALKDFRFDLDMSWMTCDLTCLEGRQIWPETWDLTSTCLKRLKNSSSLNCKLVFENGVNPFVISWTCYCLREVEWEKETISTRTVHSKLRDLQRRGC